MSNVSQLPSTAERKERRRLHLREVTEPAPAGETVGAVLGAARTERGIEAATIAKALKMSRGQLEAIEANDFAKLPGRTYAVGFVRAYAKYLHLDDEAIVQRFKDEFADQEVTKPVDLIFPEAQDEQRLPNGSIVILALVIAMVIYGISYLTIPSRNTTTAKADEPAVIVEQPKVEVAGPAPAAAVPAKVDPAPSALVPAAAEPTAPEPPTTFVAGDNALPKAEAATPSFTIAQVQPIADEKPAAQTTPVATNSAARITLTALEPAYIRVRQTQAPRKIIVARVLETGESFQGPDTTNLIMQTGNAGGLQVAVDGRVIGVMGKRGEVLTRIPFDPSYFLERMAASQ
ncbi:MAG: helix-turn-helix domain-containing protein [Alphaproteobacteria bacterium]|nr:helix-turn-helix domain-containing protein [Alphaproteobacteria bacterium]